MLSQATRSGVDLSVISQIAPIFVFLLGVLVIGAILVKNKLFGDDSKWISGLVAVAVVALLVSFGRLVELAMLIVPWFTIIFLLLFFAVFMMGFVGDSVKNFYKPVGITSVVLLGIVFILSVFAVFSDIAMPYLPGYFFGFGNADPELLFFFDWLYSPRVSGAIALIVVAAIAMWAVVKSK